MLPNQSRNLPQNNQANFRYQNVIVPGVDPNIQVQQRSVSVEERLMAVDQRLVNMQSLLEQMLLRQSINFAPTFTNTNAPNFSQQNPPVVNRLIGGSLTNTNRGANVEIDQTAETQQNSTNTNRNTNNNSLIATLENYHTTDMAISSGLNNSNYATNVSKNIVTSENRLQSYQSSINNNKNDLSDNLKDILHSSAYCVDKYTSNSNSSNSKVEQNVQQQTQETVQQTVEQNPSITLPSSSNNEVILNRLARLTQDSDLNELQKIANKLQPILTIPQLMGPKSRIGKILTTYAFWDLGAQVAFYYAKQISDQMFFTPFIKQNFPAFVKAAYPGQAAMVEGVESLSIFKKASEAIENLMIVSALNIDLEYPNLEEIEKEIANALNIRNTRTAIAPPVATLVAPPVATLVASTSYQTQQGPEASNQSKNNENSGVKALKIVGNVAKGASTGAAKGFKVAAKGAKGAAKGAAKIALFGAHVTSSFSPMIWFHLGSIINNTVGSYRIVQENKKISQQINDLTKSINEQQTSLVSLVHKQYPLKHIDTAHQEEAKAFKALEDVTLENNQETTENLKRLVNTEMIKTEESLAEQKAKIEELKRKLNQISRKIRKTDEELKSVSDVLNSWEGARIRDFLTLTEEQLTNLRNKKEALTEKLEKLRNEMELLDYTIRKEIFAYSYQKLGFELLKKQMNTDASNDILVDENSSDDGGDDGAQPPRRGPGDDDQPPSTGDDDQPPGRGPGANNQPPGRGPGANDPPPSTGADDQPPSTGADDQPPSTGAGGGNADGVNASGGAPPEVLNQYESLQRLESLILLLNFISFIPPTDLPLLPATQELMDINTSLLDHSGRQLLTKLKVTDSVANLILNRQAVIEFTPSIALGYDCNGLETFYLSSPADPITTWQEASFSQYLFSCFPELKKELKAKEVDEEELDFFGENPQRLKVFQSFCNMIVNAYNPENNKAGREKLLYKGLKSFVIDITKLEGYENPSDNVMSLIGEISKKMSSIDEISQNKNMSSTLTFADFWFNIVCKSGEISSIAPDPLYIDCAKIQDTNQKIITANQIYLDKYQKNFLPEATQKIITANKIYLSKYQKSCLTETNKTNSTASLGLAAVLAEAATANLSTQTDPLLFSLFPSKTDNSELNKQTSFRPDSSGSRLPPRLPPVSAIAMITPKKVPDQVVNPVSLHPNSSSSNQELELFNIKELHSVYKQLQNIFENKIPKETPDLPNFVEGKIAKETPDLPNFVEGEIANKTPDLQSETMCADSFSCEEIVE